MLDKILNLVRGQVDDKVDSIGGIPEEKREETVEATTTSLIDGLKKSATPDKLSSLLSMFGGSSDRNTNATPAAAQNVGTAGASAGTTTATRNSGGMEGILENSVVEALTSKVGLSPAIAGAVATAVIPAVMSLFKKKVDDGDEPGFNLGSITKALGGGSANASQNGQPSSGGSSIMNMLGGIIGRNK